MALLEVCLQTKPGCLCFFFLSVSQNREGKKKRLSLPSSYHVHGAVGGGGVRAPGTALLAHHRLSCPVRKPISKKWHELLVAGLRRSGTCIHICPAPYNGLFLPLGLDAEKEDFFFFFLTYIHTHRLSANPQTSISWYFQRHTVSYRPQPFPTNPERVTESVLKPSRMIIPLDLAAYPCEHAGWFFCL